MARNARGQFVPGESGNPTGKKNDSAVVHQDGTWSSAFGELGQSNDRRGRHSFGSICLSYQQVAELWERDGIAAKAIEEPSAEAFREGYELSLGNDNGKMEDLKAEIEERFEELGVDDAIELAWRYKRAYGAGLILLGTDDSSRLDQPLDVKNVRSLDYLTVFEPLELTPEDPVEALKDYGKPQYYRVNTGSSTLFAGTRTRAGSPRPKVSSRIHHSRLIVFDGIKTSRYLKNYNPISQYYGASVVNRFFESLRDCGIGFSSAGNIATDVSMAVVAINGLRQAIAKGDGSFKARMDALNLGRETARMIVLDAEKETFQQQTTQLSGVPDLLDRLSIKLAADIGIPLSVLFGYSPSSLGQPGEVELKQWYNKIRAMQRRTFAPIIKKLARMTARTLRERKLPSNVIVKWHELERLNEKDRAEARLNTARADEVYLKYGAIHPDEIRKSRWSGPYSYETTIDDEEDAPGFVAPLPVGVGGAPSGGAPSGGGASKLTGGRPAAGNAVAHTVTGYARRNPVKRDSLSNLEYARRKLEEARAAGASEEVIKAHEYVVAYEEEAEKLEATLRRADERRAAYEQAMKENDLELRSDRIENRGSKWVVLSMSGKEIGEYDTEDDARERLRQIEAAKAARGDHDGTGEHVEFMGLQICVENPVGSTRSWVDSDGVEGSTKMRYDYGYVVGSRGADGDSVDVYLGPSADAQWVYAIDQMSKVSGFTAFDEKKVMLGFDSANHARDAYLRQYDDERFYGGMTIMTLDEFRASLFSKS